MERYRLPTVALLTSVGVGYAALTGCGMAQKLFNDDSINCIENPGESVSLKLDSTLPGDQGTLTEEGIDANYDANVFEGRDAVTGKPVANEVLVSPDNSPVGVGGTDKAIDNGGDAGMDLFKRTPKDHKEPPFYQVRAHGDLHSSIVTIALECAEQQG